MERYGRDTYGDAIADVYDEWHERADTGAAVAFLSAIAADGAVLELGVGTGRLAIPLAQLGLDVHGLDTSPAMLERLLAKPGGENVSVSVGDMADIDVAASGFSLVFVAFSSLFCLQRQADQVRCFQSVAGRLLPSGRFVVECFVPDLGRFDRGQRMSTTGVEVDRVRIDAARHFAVEQRVDVQQIIVAEHGIRMVPISARYAWPAELDLMAQLAGLQLEHRWGGWDREPFTDASGFHVSVYRPSS